MDLWVEAVGIACSWLNKALSLMEMAWDLVKLEELVWEVWSNDAIDNTAFETVGFLSVDAACADSLASSC